MSASYRSSSMYLVGYLKRSVFGGKSAFFYALTLNTFW
ncbi:Unknown protein sequence [Pseudomonas syringae pv. maculicola]|nr:Unknown protein sequence [Pseudomonas syringae pv. maculicola]